MFNTILPQTNCIYYIINYIYIYLFKYLLLKESRIRDLLLHFTDAAVWKNLFSLSSNDLNSYSLCDIHPAFQSLLSQMGMTPMVISSRTSSRTLTVSREVNMVTLC